MKPIKERTIYKARRAEVVEELNGKPVKHIGTGLAIVMSIIITAFLFVVKRYEEWIDSKGHIVMLVFALVGLACFAYWALVGRKK